MSFVILIFTGIELHNDAHFDGNGFLEFNRDLLDHADQNRQEVFAFELSTNSSDGLIFWHGQTPEKDGIGQDYIALAGKFLSQFDFSQMTKIAICINFQKLYFLISFKH